MIENMETPAKLATSIISDFKQSADGIIDACSKIALAWDASDEGGPWNQDKFIIFIDKLAEAKIGPGSSVFFVTKKKEGLVFSKSPKAGIYYQLMSVGKCPVFKSKDFVLYNRTTSYSVLYRLSVLYKKIIDNPSKSLKQKKADRAEKVVIDLVKKFGAELTRAEVNAAISKIGSRQSRAPEEDYPTESFIERKVGSTDLSSLIKSEAEYDYLLITPTDTFLDEAQNYSTSTLMDMAPYNQLLSSKSEVTIIGSGKHLNGLKNLARTTGNLNNIYCVRQTKDNNQILDLSKELLVFTNTNFNLTVGPKSNEKAEEFVRRVITEKSANSQRLHLFSENEAEGWDSVSPENSIIEE
jgi:hypothetical protein